jgi:hypothetical protein
VGQDIHFALEFWLPRGSELVPVEEQAPCTQHVSEDEYDVIGRVITAEPAVVIDSGLLVYTEDERPTVELGQMVAARCHLGVDPFMYFERLGRNDAVPPMMYRWRVNRIRRQTAPLVEVSPRYFERDRTKWGWEDVQHTDAWEDDGGSADYLLDVERLRDPPLRKRGLEAVGD